MLWAGLGPIGWVSIRMAALLTPPFYGRAYLARLNRRGYISPSATIYHRDLRMGERVFIGEHTVIFQDKDGGAVELGEGVRIYDYNFIQTGDGGSVTIGDRTTIQPRCQFSAYVGNIRIGSHVSIAPNCSFYPYDHGFEPGIPISRQPLQTKGDIIIGDNSWLGVGVIVLSGVRIGNGAVVAAGSVVIDDVPDDAIAAGSPARVVKYRSDLQKTAVVASHGDS